MTCKHCDNGKPGGCHADAGSCVNRMPRIWVLTADRHEARIFKKEGRDALAMAGEACHAGAHSHHGDSREIPVQAIADWLDEAAQKDSFDRLILVAPPHTLGALRKVLSKPVNMRIAAEINKDLTKLPADDLQRELGNILWF